MSKFRLWLARCRQNPKNVHYPDGAVISCRADLEKAVRLDHVAAHFQGGIRGLKNFLESDVSILDCDNDHTDNPTDWVTPETLYYLFPDVSFAIVASRNDGKEKGNKSARPRFHAYFFHRRCLSAADEEKLKRAIYERYPFFDKNCLDAARFIYGVEAPHYVMWHEGPIDIADFLEKTRSPWIRAMEEPLLLPAGPGTKESEGDDVTDSPAESAPPVPFGAKETVALAHRAAPCISSAIESPKATYHRATPPILEGSRNSTLSSLAARLVKRYGDTSVAYEKFLEQANRCEPALPDREISSIWKSAQKFYQKICQDGHYVAPAMYAKVLAGKLDLKPSDYSDMGEAKMLKKVYEKRLVYTISTDFMIYDGIRWQENKQKAYGFCQALLDHQLDEAITGLSVIEKSLSRMGIDDQVIAQGGRNLRKTAGKIGASLCAAQEEIREYVSFVAKRRDFFYIDATLKTVRPMVQKEISDFDTQAMVLNTPDGTYDLSQGMAGKLAHKSEDFLTKVTAFSPDDRNEDLWLSAVDTFFMKDEELIRYVQQLMGLSAIGKVYKEALFIAYGNGANGKSTFFNSIARVLGDYSGTLSADVLMAGCRRNVKPEMAELRGKRLIIASELEEGMRLNASMVKQLCSVDEITAEKKYMAPFRFVPSHSLVLCTNHLPKVGGRDLGIWRRILLIPFQAKLPVDGKQKNYTDYLVENSGGAILKWVIEGARQVIENQFEIHLPKSVQEIQNQYQEANDWLAHFLDDCCEIRKDYQQPSGTFYEAYRNYAFRQGDYIRSTSDFYTALAMAGYERGRAKSGRYVQGVRLKVEYLENQ